MANIKYFSDLDGEAIELKGIYSLKNAEFAARWPEVRGMRWDGYGKLVGYPTAGTGGALPVTRKIEFKAFPSRHECNSKCLNGKVNGTCECQCGGKNHGAGGFRRLVEADALAADRAVNAAKASPAYYSAADHFALSQQNRGVL